MARTTNTVTVIGNAAPSSAPARARATINEPMPRIRRHAALPYANGFHRFRRRPSSPSGAPSSARAPKHSTARRRFALFPVLAILAVLAACDGTGVSDPNQEIFGLNGPQGSSHSPSGNGNGSGTGGVMLSLTNATRASVGVAALTGNSKLSAAAAMLCQELAQTGIVSHDQPGTKAPSEADRLAAVGYAYTSAAENLTYGPDSTAQQAVNDFINSPDHYANVISATYTQYGDAMLKIGTNYCWVQEFGAPQ